MDNIDQLADALNGHSVTDDQGEVGDETSGGDTVATNQTPVDDGSSAGNAEEPEKSAPAEDKGDEGPEMVETIPDETGKRYVPEARFKEVYAKWKAAERVAKIAGETPPPRPVAVPQKPLQKTDTLEVELLKTTLPQFNPESPEYNRDVDELGFSLFEGSRDTKGNYTMTRMEAGRKAIGMIRKLTAKVADTKLEARTVKAQQSDQGITNRVLNRGGQQTDPTRMTLEEKEAWLKETGNW